jgi:hypothetical protein
VKEEQDMDQLQKQQETKLKLLKNRLIMMIPNQGSEQLTLDEVVKKCLDTFTQLNTTRREAFKE